MAVSRGDKNLFGERWIWWNDGMPRLVKVYHNKQGLSRYRYPVTSLSITIQEKTNHPGYETREACIKAHLQRAENRIGDLRAELEKAQVDLARSRQMLEMEVE